MAVVSLCSNVALTLERDLDGGWSLSIKIIIKSRTDTIMFFGILTLWIFRYDYNVYNSGSENCTEPTDEDCKDVVDIGGHAIKNRWPCKSYVLIIKVISWFA